MELEPKSWKWRQNRGTGAIDVELEPESWNWRHSRGTGASRGSGARIVELAP